MLRNKHLFPTGNQRQQLNGFNWNGLLYSQGKQKRIFPDEKKTSVSHFSQDPHFQQMLEATSTVKKNVDNPIQSQSLIPAF